MSAALMPTLWRLNELMARHRVSGKDLAAELGISENSMSALRKSPTMPRINGKRLDEIAAALSKLSASGGGIRGIDLLEEG